jgi:hypothetical protein
MKMEATMPSDEGTAIEHALREAGVKVDDVVPVAIRYPILPGRISYDARHTQHLQIAIGPPVDSFDPGDPELGAASLCLEATVHTTNVLSHNARKSYNKMPDSKREHQVYIPKGHMRVGHILPNPHFLYGCVKCRDTHPVHLTDFAAHIQRRRNKLKCPGCHQHLRALSLQPAAYDDQLIQAMRKLPEYTEDATLLSADDIVPSLWGVWPVDKAPSDYEFDHKNQTKLVKHLAHSWLKNSCTIRPLSQLIQMERPALQKMVSVVGLSEPTIAGYVKVDEVQGKTYQMGVAEWLPLRTMRFDKDDIKCRLPYRTYTTCV